MKPDAISNPPPSSVALGTFELALTQAFAETDAPAGFAERVLARAAREAADAVQEATPVIQEAAPAIQEATPRVPKPARATPEPATILTMHPPRATPLQRWRTLYALAATVLIGLMLAGFSAERRHLRQVRNERQFDLAVAVTNRALDHTRLQLARAGIDLAQ